MDKLRPDYMVIGFMKCGTTSLYYMLNQHPKIYNTSITSELTKIPRKELHYFDKYYSRGNDWYNNEFFSKCPKDCITGDYTVTYIESEKVLRRIKEYNPNTKFIVMLRNPIDRAFSAYQRAKYNAKAWHNKVLKMESLDDTNNNLVNCILNKGKYVNYFKKAFEMFPQNQFHIIKSEDFYKDPNIEGKRVCEFLNIEKVDFSSVHSLKTKYTEELKQKTIDNLKKYYEPYNKELEKLLNRKMDWNNE